MRSVGAFIAVSCLTGVIAAVGCGSKSPTPVPGGSSSSSSSAVSSGTGGSGAGGGGTGGGGTGGSAPMVSIDCPTGTPPSGGSCVAFASDAGVELDASTTASTCNPITNDGCTGTDVCNPDTSGFYACQSAGSPADVKCGAAGATMTSTCAVGGLLVQLQGGQFVCVQMCCTAADCGGSPSQCDTAALQTPLPSGVGVCDTPG